MVFYESGTVRGVKKRVVEALVRFVKKHQERNSHLKVDKYVEVLRRSSHFDFCNELIGVLLLETLSPAPGYCNQRQKKYLNHFIILNS
jgi:hypothetical protein